MDNKDFDLLIQNISNDFNRTLKTNISYYLESMTKNDDLIEKFKAILFELDEYKQLKLEFNFLNDAYNDLYKENEELKKTINNTKNIKLDINENKNSNDTKIINNDTQDNLVVNDKEDKAVKSETPFPNYCGPAPDCDCPTPECDPLEEILNNFNTEKYKRGIYIYGDSGIGKTKFILNLLKKINYDVIYYDNSIIRNKSLIENIGSNNLSNTNVYSLFTDKPKKMVIVIDDIDGMNYGDKNGIISLIKLIRVKKTKKQKLENITNNPIICINNKNSDKKILELMKVCHSFELKNPTNNQLLKIINTIIPNIFRYSKKDNEFVKKNILSFLNNNLMSINKLIFYEKNDIIYNKFFNNYISNINESNENIKLITKDFLANHYNFDKINNILESDRTILSLLFHENIIQLLDKKHIKIYLKILDNFIFSDYIDRIIFQKQIWQLTEMNYIIKLFYNNFILKTNNLFSNIEFEDIIFTKILTKYSSEYNNYIFIYNLLQSFLLEKKDIYILFHNYSVNYDINDIVYKLESNNISKLEIIRIIKFINQLINYTEKNEKINENTDMENIELI